jgi:serine protease AprX
MAMCYSDSPGETLVNNLNMIVTDRSGKRYVGNQSTAAGSNMSLDATNNVEVIQISKAKAGESTVDVVAANVSVGPQNFALAAVIV